MLVYSEGFDQDHGQLEAPGGFVIVTWVWFCWVCRVVAVVVAVGGVVPLLLLLSLVLLLLLWWLLLLLFLFMLYGPEE
jgi:hypothetical protein